MSLCPEQCPARPSIICLAPTSLFLPAPSLSFLIVLPTLSDNSGHPQTPPPTSPLASHQPNPAMSPRGHLVGAVPGNLYWEPLSLSLTTVPTCGQLTPDALGALCVLPHRLRLQWWVSAPGWHVRGEIRSQRTLPMQCPKSPSIPIGSNYLSLQEPVLTGTLLLQTGALCRNGEATVWDSGLNVGCPRTLPSVAQRS